MKEHHHRRTLERLRENLARADNDLREAQHFLDPQSSEEAEKDLVHAVAAARLAIAEAMARVRAQLGEPEA